MALLLGFLFSANVIAQDPPRTGTKGKASRAKSIAGKFADTAVTSAAAMAADTVLGDNAAAVAALVSPTGTAGVPTCPEGLVPFRVAPTAAAAPVAAMPTPGSMIVGAAKKKIGGETADTAPPSTSGAQYLQLAGVLDDRMTMVDEQNGDRKASKTAKRGDARIELVRLPAEPAP